MAFSRDELERELVRFDKQKILTQCLKLYDTNVELVLKIEAYQTRVKEMEEMVEGLVEKNRELKERKWIKVLNDNIQAKIDKKRNKRKK